VSGAVEVGLYGKLPSHGDFLKRRVPPEFEAPWDEWLQAGIAASRELLAEGWPETYLTSPVWRFALTGGACGRSSVAGLLAPSVDRVGRYFPLTLAWRLPPTVGPLSFALLPDGFLNRAEQLLVDGLTADVLDFEHFDAQVSSLAEELGNLLDSAPPDLRHEDLDRLIAGADRAWQLPSAESSLSASTLGALLARLLESGYAPLSLWWTEGSAAVAPCWLVTRGLPTADAFVALLDGSWQRGAWRSVQPREAAVLAAVAGTAPAPPLRAPQSGYRSAALTDPGSVRPANQDAFLERAEIGLWAVADGLGGLSQGDVASRMVCDALAGLVPEASLEAAIETLRRRVDDVNATLYRASQRPLDPVQSGSTVVALAIRDAQAAILWAGDSRAYRLRGGKLEALTVDHGAEPDETASPEERAPTSEFAISRAVGGEETLQLDLRTEAVEAGDRFLLCSDGLTRALAEGEIAKVLADATAEPAACARRLIDAALAATANDNVTVLIVDAR
jgi:type VI secretion system protein ImpM